MNYNHNYANYQPPNSNTGYAYPNASPGYSQAGQQNAYSTGQRPQQVAQQYGQQYPQQYSQNAYQNLYQPRAVPQHSPQGYSHPVVVIPSPPQRSPAQSHSPTTSTSPNFQQTFHHPAHQLQQSQHSWQNYRQPHRPTQYPSYPQFDSLSSSIPPAPQPRPLKTQAMVEIPVASPRYPQNPPPPHQQLQHAPQRASSLSSPHSADVQNGKKSMQSTSPPVDLQQLLLLLAEDYINDAHSMGSLVALYRRAEDMDMYNKRIATGLRCIEASLLNYRLLPRSEAFLILQYTNLLFQETENYVEVEKWLGKGVSKCRHDFIPPLTASGAYL